MTRRSPIHLALALLAHWSASSSIVLDGAAIERDFFVPLSLRGRYERSASVADLAYVAARRRRERQTHRRKRWRGGAL